MPSKLNIFPARVAIGAVQPDGSVLMTQEFARALGDLMVRVGGANSLDMNEIVALLGAESTPAAAVGQLAADVRAVALEAVSRPDFSARVARLEQRVEDLAQLVVASGQAPTDWEHPGKIGAATANSGKFTTVDTSGAARVATLTVQTGLGAFNKGLSVNGPATLGATGTTQWSWETPIMRYFVGDGSGYSLRFTKRVGSVNTDLATFTDGGAATFLAGFGCNGKAAQTAYALGAAATDLASVITLANNLRTMSINNGTGA